MSVSQCHYFCEKLQACFVGRSGKQSTMWLEKHNVLRSASNAFCVLDSRGLDYEKMEESLDGLCEWMEGGVRVCLGECDHECGGEALGLCWCESSGYAKRRVNCVLVVANAAEVCGAMKAGDAKPLEATRQVFSCPAINKCSKIFLCLSLSLRLSRVVFHFALYQYPFTCITIKKKKKIEKRCVTGSIRSTHLPAR